MDANDFDYHLPEDAIATVPAEPRDSARLLVDTGDARPLDRHVRDLPDLLGPDDVIVVNDSRVIPARLALHRRSGAAVEVLLIEPRGDGHRRWEALVRPGGKIRVGEALVDGEGTSVVTMIGRGDTGDTFVVEFDGTEDPLIVLERLGSMPLPPYLGPVDIAAERYQTVYANRPGSAAAPTAGLHLTTGILESLREVGVGIERVELVVGLDTFRPLDAGDPRQHRIHTESYTVDPQVFARIRDARRVVAVGTTSVRALETVAQTGIMAGRSSLYIHRGYEWQVVDAMMTNFHLPRTTLLVMIDAFIGSRWRRLYDHGLASGYRFLSFGDAMLLDRCIP